MCCGYKVCEHSVNYFGKSLKKGKKKMNPEGHNLKMVYGHAYAADAVCGQRMGLKRGVVCRIHDWEPVLTEGGAVCPFEVLEELDTISCIFFAGFLLSHLCGKF